jgi:hypothetical protein
VFLVIVALHRVILHVVVDQVDTISMQQAWVDGHRHLMVHLTALVLPAATQTITHARMVLAKHARRPRSQIFLKWARVVRLK